MMKKIAALGLTAALAFAPLAALAQTDSATPAPENGVSPGPTDKKPMMHHHMMHHHMMKKHMMKKHMMKKKMSTEASPEPTPTASPQ